MNDGKDEDAAFSCLERLCERIILDPDHEMTRRALSEHCNQGWLALETLIDISAPDHALATDAASFGHRITAYTIKTPSQNRQIVTFYCAGLNAVTGTGLIDALSSLETRFH